MKNPKVKATKGKPRSHKSKRAVEPPDLPDLNRCHAWRDNGERCSLDLGHYRDPTDPKPCPHIGDDGVEWFGVVRTPQRDVLKSA